jgi:hypothetical protein
MNLKSTHLVILVTDEHAMMLAQTFHYHALYAYRVSHFPSPVLYLSTTNCLRNKIEANYD